MTSAALERTAGALDVQRDPGPVRNRCASGTIRRRPRCERERQVEAALEVARVILEPGRRPMRKAADQVPSPQRHAVDPDDPRGLVDERLDHVRGIGAAGAAIRTGRDLVGPHAEHLDVGDVDVVAAGDQRGGRVRRDRRRRQQVAAEIRAQAGAECEHPALAVERELEVAFDPPPLVGADEVLEAVLGPLDRHANRDRGGRDRGHFRRDHAL